MKYLKEIIEQKSKIKHNCKRCGKCCKSYGKIALTVAEKEFIKSRGEEAIIRQIMDKKDLEMGIDIFEFAKNYKPTEQNQHFYMFHPEDKGCVFLCKEKNKYCCKIYDLRPKVCNEFECQYADRENMDNIIKKRSDLYGQDRKNS